MPRPSPKPTDSPTLKELDEAYRIAMTGTAEPAYIGMSIPDVGFVELTKSSVYVNNELANEEQKDAIRKVLRAHAQTKR